MKSMLSNKYMGKKVKGSNMEKGENCAWKIWYMSNENTKKKYMRKTYGDKK